MKDPRLWNLKQRALHDRTLSDPARTIIMRLIDSIICSPAGADDEFGLTWRQAARHLGWGTENTLYGYVAELQKRTYLFPSRKTRDSRTGCPSVQHFKLVFNSPASSGIKPPASSGTNSPAGSGSHIKYVLRTRKSNRGPSAPRQDGEGSSSLRSQGKGRKTVHATAPADADAALARERIAREFGEAARKALTA